MRIDRIKLGVLLVQRNWNYADLAKKSKICRQTISYIKNGKSCSFKTAVAIANALGVEVTDLLED